MPFHCGGGSGPAAPDGMHGAVPIFVGGSDSNSPPPPFGLGHYSAACGVGLIPDLRAVKNMSNAECWRWHCPVCSRSPLVIVPSLWSLNLLCPRCLCLRPPHSSCLRRSSCDALRCEWRRSLSPRPNVNACHPQVTSGDVIMKHFSIPTDEAGMFEELVVTALFFLVFRLLTGPAMHFVSHVKR